MFKPAAAMRTTWTSSSATRRLTFGTSSRCYRTQGRYHKECWSNWKTNMKRLIFKIENILFKTKDSYKKSYVPFSEPNKRTKWQLWDINDTWRQTTETKKSKVVKTILLPWYNPICLEICNWMFGDLIFSFFWFSRNCFYKGFSQLNMILYDVLFIL